MPLAEPTPGLWYSTHEAAALCHRAEPTIRDLVFKRRLPRRLVRVVPLRPKRMFLSAETVRLLQTLTLKL